MKLTEDFLSRELQDDEMIVINGGLASPLTGGDWCGVSCNGSDGSPCGISCSETAQVQHRTAIPSAGLA